MERIQGRRGTRCGGRETEARRDGRKLTVPCNIVPHPEESRAKGGHPHSQKLRRLSFEQEGGDLEADSDTHQRAAYDSARERTGWCAVTTHAYQTYRRHALGDLIDLKQDLVA